MTLKFLGGGMMGLVPLIFDWLFLIAEGDMIYGLVGPALFMITALSSAFLTFKMDVNATISAAMGTVALLPGILSIPLMLDAAKTTVLGVVDCAFGSCSVLLFVVIGGSFAWNEFSSVFRGISLSQTIFGTRTIPATRSETQERLSQDGRPSTTHH